LLDVIAVVRVPEEKPEVLIPHLVDFLRGAPRQAART
jgi:hypothetical protein